MSVWTFLGGSLCVFNSFSPFQIFIYFVFWGKPKGKPKKCDHCRKEVERALPKSTFLNSAVWPSTGKLRRTLTNSQAYTLKLMFSRCPVVAVGYVDASYPPAAASFLFICPCPMLILATFFVSASIPPAPAYLGLPAACLLSLLTTYKMLSLCCIWETNVSFSHCRVFQQE